MRLDLGLNKTVSRLIPTFMRNPRMYQWLMSLVSPLEDVNEQFKEFAAIKKKEAQLNSQTKLLEDYLNSTFSPTFPNPDTDRVQIKHGIESAQATFFASELLDPDAGINPPYLSGNMVVYNRAEDVNIETIDTNSEYVSIDNNKVLSSASDLEFEVSGTWDISGAVDVPIIDWGDDSAGVGHINFRVAADNIFSLIIGDGAGSNVSQPILLVTQSDFMNATLKLVDLVIYLNGVEIGEITPTMNSVSINIDLSQECRISHSDTFGAWYASSIVHGCKLNGEIFNFNENTGSVVTGSNGTTGSLISTANTEDMWGDDNGAKESPFTYFDYEDFGTLPESFRLILPSSIEGTDKHLSIVATINKYIIDTNKYDIVYS